MKKQTKNRLIALASLALPMVNQELSIAHAQGTAFTYQGLLNDGTNPAHGNYDLTFTIFDGLTSGSAVAGPATNSAVGVTNGLLNVTLDFGDNPFSAGAQRWLEIAARANGTSAFTTLAPRQKILATPYAITAGNLAGTTGNSLTVNAGRGLGGGGTMTLGGSTTLNNAGVLSVAGNSDITATTANGAVTLGDTASNTDAPGTLVKRDANGNFSAASISLDNSLNLPVATAGAGVVYSGGAPLIYRDNNNNIFAGQGAGNFTLSGGLNTGIGFAALSSDTSGNGDTAIGDDALLSNTNGSDNTATGFQALQSNESGNANTATGTDALQHNTSGGGNTATGTGALYENTTGIYNTADGLDALQDDTSGGENTASGTDALVNLTTGNGNIALGVNAGSDIVTGGNNIDIGNTGFGDESGVIRIGTLGTHTKAVFNGIFGTTVGGGAPVQVNANGLLGTVTSSRRFKQNIQAMADASDVLFDLQPVTFQYKPDLDPEGVPQFGLIAEEVEKVDPALVLHDDQHQIYTVRYEAVNAMLLNEFLKEHRQVEEQKTELQEFKQRLAALEKIPMIQKPN